MGWPEYGDENWPQERPGPYWPAEEEATPDTDAAEDVSGGAATAPGYLYGLYWASDDRTVVIQPGAARDSTGESDIQVGAALTVDIDDSGDLGLDTGAVAADTWYYVYVIGGNGGSSAILSASASSPTLPSGYDYFRRIGSVFYVSNIRYVRGFPQLHRMMHRVRSSHRYFNNGPGTGVVEVTLSQSVANQRGGIPPEAVVVELESHYTEATTSAHNINYFTDGGTTSVMFQKTHTPGFQVNKTNKQVHFESTQQLHFQMSYNGTLRLCMPMWEEDL